MDHTEAVGKKLTESYLLGELTPQECEAFEEHYFTCAECAEDIKAAAALVANVKEVLREDRSLSRAAERVPSYAGWLSWWRPAYSFAAVAAVLAVLIYQNVVTIPHIKEQFAKSNVPQALASFSFASSGSRGAKPQQVQVGPKQSFMLYISITSGDNSVSFDSYSFSIQSQDGAPQFSMPVSAEIAKRPVPVYVPGGSLQPGKYFLIIQGNRGANNAPQVVQEIARYPFVLENKN